MRRIYQFMALIVGVLLMVNVHAQNPDNQFGFDGSVKWMMLTESGVLVASTGEALVGIKAGETTPFFKIDRLNELKRNTWNPFRELRI